MKRTAWVIAHLTHDMRANCGTLLEVADTRIPVGTEVRIEWESSNSHCCPGLDIDVYRVSTGWYMQVGDGTVRCEPVPIRYCPMCGEQLAKI